MFLTVIQQVSIIFLLMAVGFAIEKLNFLHEQGEQDMIQILCFVVSPCIIVKAFEQPFSPVKGRSLLFSFGCVVLIFLFSIAALKLIFNRRVVRDPARRMALEFGSVYTNCGFLGIPVINAILGPQGIFYGASYLAGFNIFVWTHGLALYHGKKSWKSIANMLLNPNIIAIAIGLALFSASIKLPLLISSGIDYICDLNTPLSMLVIGAGIGRIRFAEILSDKWIWAGIAARNIALPLAVLAALHFAPLDKTASLALVIMSACPVASMLVIFDRMMGVDAAFSTKFLTFSTLCSIATLPLMICLDLM